MTFDSLKLENITFSYPNRPPALEKFSLDFPAKPLVWIKAAPGFGKSSLLKIMAGLLSPQEGKYWINDVCVSEMSFSEFLPFRLEMGYSFDMHGLLSNRTIYENLMLPLLFHQRFTTEEADARVCKWMAKFGLAKVRNERPFAVSGGQRKSTVLLRSLIHNPKLVLLDDPMAGLKEDGRAAFAELIEENRREHGLQKIIFCAERELPLAQKAFELNFEKQGFGKKQAEAA
jgi:phospholipid/cholesterol/gamma-HCH transport system ATP-binding protein